MDLQILALYIYDRAAWHASASYSQRPKAHLDHLMGADEGGGAADGWTVDPQAGGHAEQGITLSGL